MEDDYMRIIQIQGGNIDAALNELIECKVNGEFAVLEISEFLVNTTDDVPNNFRDLSKDEVINFMQQTASKRRFELRAAKLGISGDNLTEQVVQHDFEEEHKGRTN